MPILHFFAFDFSLPSNLEMTILSIPAWENSQIVENLSISFPRLLQNTDIFLRNSSFLTLFISMIFYWIQIGINPSNFTLQKITKANSYPAEKKVKPFFPPGVTAKASLVPSLNRQVLPKQPEGSHAEVGLDKEINLGTVMMLLSNILIMCLLAFRWIESGHFPLSNLYESLMFLSWTSTIIHLLLEMNAFEFNINVFSLLEGDKQTQAIGTPYSGPSASLKIRSFGFFKNPESLSRIESQILKKVIGSVISPIAFFTNAFATFSLPTEMQKASPLVPALQSNWLMMHVTVMIISYSALIIGSLLSIAFLILISSSSFKIPSLVNPISGALATPTKILQKPPFLNRFWKAKAGRHNPLAFFNPLFTITFSPQKFTEIFSLRKAELSKAIQSQTYPKNTILLRNSEGLLGENLVALPNETKNDIHFLKKEPDQSNPSNAKKSAKMTLAWNFDNLSYRVLGIGFPFLTIGILSGAVWANEAWGSYWSWDPKETWALLTWLIFAIYLHARITKGWQGKKPAIIASFGLLAIWICFLGVNLIGEGLHSYGWFSQ